MTSGNQLSFIDKPDDAQEKDKLVLFFDGAARNNPGPAGAGIVIKRNDTTIGTYGFYLGNKTNNQAEYLALLLGIIIIKKYLKPNEELTIYGDSELLVQQMTGRYRVKNPILQQLFNAVYILSKDIPITFKHIRRINNSIADKLANQGIDNRKEITEEFKRVLNEYHFTL